MSTQCTFNTGKRLFTETASKQSSQRRCVTEKQANFQPKSPDSLLRFNLMLFQVFNSLAVAEFPSTWLFFARFYKARTWSSLTSVFSKDRWQIRNLSTTTAVLSIYQTLFSLGLQFSTPLPRTHNRGLHK